MGGLIKDSFILFAATVVVNLSNFIFHIFAANKLGPENYGVVSTLLGMIIIVAMPAQALQMSIVKSTAEYKARRRFGAIEALFRKTTTWFLIMGAVYFTCFVAGSQLLMDYFAISDRMLIIILGAIAAMSLLMPVVRGMLQGLQKFMSLGINQIVDALSRLSFLLIAVAAGWSVRGALGASFVGAFTAFAVGVGVLLFLFRYKEDKKVEVIKKKEFFGYAVPVFGATLGFWLLSYMDLFLVKHFFNPYDAGLYSATQIIGKAFIFFSAAMVTVLFPKVTESHALKKDTFGMLLKSLGLTAAVCALGIIVCMVFPQFIRVFGKDYLQPKVLEMVRLFGIAVMPLVMLNVILNYGLAKQKYNFIWVMLAGVPVYMAALYRFHGSFIQVLGVLFTVTLAVLAGCLAAFKLEKEKKKK